MIPILEEIDLSKTTKNGGAGLEVGPTYMILYSGRYYVGEFEEQWYGLNFRGIYNAGAQYDPPGKNCSDFQKIWKITNAEEISISLENSYAISKKEHGINHKMKIYNQLVTKDTSIEYFKYVPDYSSIENQEEEN